VSGTGYTGVALSGVNSVNIRDAWRVNIEGLSLTSNDINKLSNEAAERYAQEIAIIQAMAQEAYTQANNRILKIEEWASANVSDVGGSKDIGGNLGLSYQY